MRALLPFAILLASCSFDTSAKGSDSFANPNQPDADPLAPDADPLAPDADPLAPDATPPPACSDWAQQPTILDPCVDITIQINPLNLDLNGSYFYNTDSGILLNTLGVEVPHTSTILGSGQRDPRVIVTGHFSLAMGAQLRATGKRPLMIVAWGDMTIDGKINVSSNAQDGIGAGANSALCEAPTMGSGDSDGSGGGGGGGFGTAGGAGGLGRSTQEDNPGGIGGQALAMAFHGGCIGAKGGDDGNPNDSLAGDGSSGGGGIYLLARNSLTLQGEIHAGGAGGLPSVGSRAGGGGGGSGGMIALESNMLTLDAALILDANGGGGGGGSDNGTAAKAGLPGSSEVDTGTGGRGEKPPEGKGGQGDYAENAILTLDGRASDRGGGGGGGAYGYIMLRSNNLTDNATSKSPAPTLSPVLSQ